MLIKNKTLSKYTIFWLSAVCTVSLLAFQNCSSGSSGTGKENLNGVIRQFSLSEYDKLNSAADTMIVDINLDGSRIIVQTNSKTFGALPNVKKFVEIDPFRPENFREITPVGIDLNAVTILEVKYNYDSSLMLVSSSSKVTYKSSVYILNANTFAVLEQIDDASYVSKIADNANIFVLGTNKLLDYQSGKSSIYNLAYCSSSGCSMPTDLIINQTDSSIYYTQENKECPNWNPNPSDYCKNPRGSPYIPVSIIQYNWIENKKSEVLLLPRGKLATDVQMNTTLRYIKNNILHFDSPQKYSSFYYPTSSPYLPQYVYALNLLDLKMSVFPENNDLMAITSMNFNSLVNTANGIFLIPTDLKDTSLYIIKTDSSVEKILSYSGYRAHNILISRNGKVIVLSNYNDKSTSRSIMSYGL